MWNKPEDTMALMQGERESGGRAIEVTGELGDSDPLHKHSERVPVAAEWGLGDLGMCPVSWPVPAPTSLSPV